MIISAGITTYNPDLERFALNVQAVMSQVAYLMVIDNGSSNFDEMDRLLSSICPGAIVISNGENKGVATALNQVLTKSHALGSEWVLLLDQDSVVQENMVELMSGYIAEDTAILSPFIIDRNRSYADLELLPEVEPFMWPITSGSLINLKIADKIGGFQESLFIDFVDDEFSIRVYLNGYKSLRVNSARLYHEIGHLAPVGLPFPHFDNGVFTIRRAFSSGHTPIRHYYQVRNLMVLHKCYEKSLRAHGVKLPSVVKFIFHSLLFEPDRLRNFSFMLKGLCDSRKVILNYSTEGASRQ